MIKQDELVNVKTGTGFIVGEMGERHPYLKYLRHGAIVTLFDGIDNMLNYITEYMPDAKRSKSSSSKGRDHFHTFATYEMAMDIFRNKPETITNFDPAEIRVKDLGEVGNEVEYDMTGDFIDMGRYVEGVPEVMGNMQNGNARNRRANVVISLNFMARIDKDVIKHRAERVLRLVDALETGGVRTMLTAIESSECNHTEVILKRHDEPLSIGDLAVATHPDFLRRILFRIIEQSKTFDDGYGDALDFGNSLTPEVIEGGNITELDILIDGNIRSIESVDKVFDQVERLVAWEMSKPVTEVTSIKVDGDGVWFNPSGSRSDAEIRREGMEVING